EVAGALPLQTGGEVRTAAGESEQGRAVLPVLPQPPVIENADVGLAVPVEVSRLDLAPGPGEASGGSPGGLDLAEVRTRAVQREDLRAVLAVGARARVVEHGHVVLAVTVVVTGSGCTHVPAEAAGTLPLEARRGEARAGADEGEQRRAGQPVAAGPSVVEDADVGLAVTGEVTGHDLARLPGEAPGGGPRALGRGEARAGAVPRVDRRDVSAVRCLAAVVEDRDVVLAVAVVVARRHLALGVREAAGRAPLLLRSLEPGATAQPGVEGRAM